MNKLVKSALTLAVMIGVGLPLIGHGSHGGGGSAPEPSAADCGRPGEVARFAGDGVTYVDQEVTAYRPEPRTRTVNRLVSRLVTCEVPETYTYTEMVPVTVPEKQVRTLYHLASKQVPRTTTVLVPITTAEKQTRMVYREVKKEVPFIRQEWTPVVVTEKQTRLVYRAVEKQVPYTATVSTPVTTMKKETRLFPPIGPDQGPGMKGDCVAREVDVPVTTYQTKTESGTRTVSEWVPSVEELTVNVTRYQPVVRQGVETVTKYVPAFEELPVNVTRYQTRIETTMQTVHEVVPVTQEVTVDVTRYQGVTKTATRMRTEAQLVTETVPVTETYTEKVPYTYTVRVPVTPAADASGGAYRTPSRGCGLFGGWCK